MNKKMNNKGFSLVELIVVIAIMAVLVGVLAPQFIKYVENSRQSTDMQNVEQLKTAVEVEITANTNITSATITIDGGKATAALSDGTNSINLTSTANEVTLKSGSWPTTAVTYVYSFTDYEWNHPSCENTKEPKNNLATIFE